MGGKAGLGGKFQKLSKKSGNFEKIWRFIKYGKFEKVFDKFLKNFKKYWKFKKKNGKFQNFWKISKFLKNFKNFHNWKK